MIYLYIYFALTTAMGSWISVDRSGTPWPHIVVGLFWPVILPVAFAETVLKD